MSQCGGSKSCLRCYWGTDDQSVGPKDSSRKPAAVRSAMSDNLCCVGRRAERKRNHRFTQTCRHGELSFFLSFFSFLPKLCDGVVFGEQVRSAALIAETSRASHSIINICPDEYVCRGAGNQTRRRISFIAWRHWIREVDFWGFFFVVLLFFWLCNPLGLLLMLWQRGLGLFFCFCKATAYQVSNKSSLSFENFSLSLEWAVKNNHTASRASDVCVFREHLPEQKNTNLSWCILEQFIRLKMIKSIKVEFIQIQANLYWGIIVYNNNNS